MLCRPFPHAGHAISQPARASSHEREALLRAFCDAPALLAFSKHLCEEIPALSAGAAHGSYPLIKGGELCRLGGRPAAAAAALRAFCEAVLYECLLKETPRVPNHLPKHLPKHLPNHLSLITSRINHLSLITSLITSPSSPLPHHLSLITSLINHLSLITSPSSPPSSPLPHHLSLINHLQEKPELIPAYLELYQLGLTLGQLRHALPMHSVRMICKYYESALFRRLREQASFTHASFTYTSFTHASFTHASFTHTSFTHTSCTHTSFTHTSFTPTFCRRVPTHLPPPVSPPIVFSRFHEQRAAGGGVDADATGDADRKDAAAADARAGAVHAAAGALAAPVEAPLQRSFVRSLCDLIERYFAAPTAADDCTPLGPSHNRPPLNCPPPEPWCGPYLSLCALPAPTPLPAAAAAALQGNVEMIPFLAAHGVAGVDAVGGAEAYKSYRCLMRLAKISADGARRGGG